ncbi:hypothetical protein PybrP1_011876 [[Pythium] brassicae (nom. inval.)]|nr:hypothetical protein PybrP1_011876 [[Pythium] brassicae (nom. inval.)]
MVRRAREAVPTEVLAFAAKLRCWYSHPSQLFFVDKTSKNGLDSMRRCAWSARGTRAVIHVPFARGKRVSILAACDATDFVAWTTTPGTFTRQSFHRGFIANVLPKLERGRFHAQSSSSTTLEFTCTKHYTRAARCSCFYLVLAAVRPDSGNVWPADALAGAARQLGVSALPEQVLDVAVRESVRNDSTGVNLIRHCGYGRSGIVEPEFTAEERGAQETVAEETGV